MALEKNIQGPLLINDGVERTYYQWKDLEEKAPENVLQNFRFQEGLIRAYFDYYEYRRLIYETELEQKAREILASAKTIGKLKGNRTGNRNIATGKGSACLSGNTGTLFCTGRFVV